MREATSIHEAKGDWQRGSEADGNVGLRQSSLGRGMGRRRVEEGGVRKKKKGEGGEENRVEMGKEEKEKINRIF